MSRRAPRGRGSVFEDKARGRWVAQLEHDGQRFRRTRLTYQRALEALDELRELTRRGLDPGVKPTLESYLREWLDSLRVRPNTLRGYRSKLEAHVIPRIGRLKLDRVTPTTLERLFLDIERDGLGPRSTAHVRAILRNALGRAERHELIDRNPAAMTEAIAVPNRERHVLTIEQASQLARVLQGHRLEAAFALSMTMGLRQSEVLGLRWADVGGVSVQIRQTLQRAGGEYVIAPPKTPRSRRDVPLTDHIAALLEARRVVQKAEYVAAGARPTHDLIFTSLAGKELLGTNVTRELQRILVEAGLPKITYHDLRHVAASTLAARGFTLREVQAILGHASVRTTADLYTHIAPEELARKMRGVAWS